MIESISAIILATHDMPRAVRFYRMLGFEVIFGGDEAPFTSFRAGRSYLNLIAQPADGPGGAASSSTIPTSVPCMRAWSRPLSPGHGA
jgi:catechol 2,3-dioxygenase-like lactoylglutathione lyase family enzyme